MCSAFNGCSANRRSTLTLSESNKGLSKITKSELCKVRRDIVTMVTSDKVLRYLLIGKSVTLLSLDTTHLKFTLTWKR